MTKNEINEALIQNHNAFIDFINKLDEKAFTSAPEGKWSPGQQLEHIYKSIKTIIGSIGITGFCPHCAFWQIEPCF